MEKKKTLDLPVHGCVYAIHALKLTRQKKRLSHYCTWLWASSNGVMSLAGLGVAQTCQLASVLKLNVLMITLRTYTD